MKNPSRLSAADLYWLEKLHHHYFNRRSPLPRLEIDSIRAVYERHDFFGLLPSQCWREAAGNRSVDESKALFLYEISEKEKRA